ncbi:MAG: hypothetical protein WD556_07605 [Actinomycetota bacterium]
MKPEIFEREFLEVVRERLQDPLLDDPAFRLEAASLERSYPWTRIVIRFRTEEKPDALFGYWMPIWELVAWSELHQEPGRAALPAAMASDFVFEIDDDLDRASEAGAGIGDPGEDWAVGAVQWTRAAVTW